MGKPTGTAVAAKAVAAVAEGHAYADMDCQAFVEYAVNACGGNMAFAGSNDMARHAVTGLWTLQQARADGRLVPGAALFIHDCDGGEPQRYKADGLGNFSHVGFYVGKAALTDVDRNGKRRACDCAHSSAAMGRAAGSTLQNGWTHVGWLSAVYYGSEPTDAEGTAAAIPQGQTGNAKGETVAAVQAALAADTEAAAPLSAAEAYIAALGLPAKEQAITQYFTVRQGCKGGAVRRLQRWLAALAYDLGAGGQDGCFGACTDAAVRAFQQQQGLVADGTAGPRTWAALAEACRQRAQAMTATANTATAQGADTAEAADEASAPAGQA